MDTNPISLSYILPLYNVSQHLEKCLSSIIAQGLPPGTFEVILVDDGSKDSSLSIARSWQDRHSEIKVISQTNQGQSVARNVGLSLAKGTYIWFIDSDDFILKRCAVPLLRHALAVDLDLITFRVNLVEEGVAPTHAFNDKLPIDNVSTGPDYIATYNYNNSPCLYLIKHAFIKKIGLRFIEGRYCEDGMFTLALISSSCRIAHYPSTAYVYVRHAVSTTQSTTAEHSLKVIDDFIYAIGFIEKFVKAKISETAVSRQYLDRVRSRQDSYTLFLCIRLLRAPLAASVILEHYDYLRSQRWLPLASLSGTEYPGLKYKLLKCLLKHRTLFIIAVRLYRFSVSIYDVITNKAVRLI